MSSATKPRAVALEALRRLRRGELVDRAFADVSGGLDAREQAWARELVYGTVRLRGRLDFLLAAFVRSGLEALEPDVLDILRLGAYQLVEMGSVPAYAAVSQSVDLARDAGVARAAGLVNGVLQAFNRGWGSVSFPAFEADPVAHLATWGSHARWIVERWVDRWGAEAARRLVELNNTRPELYLTPAGGTAPEAIERLEAAGIEAALVDAFPTSVRIGASGGPGEVLEAVPGVIQDPAAATVARFAAVAPGSRVVDLCAAPGGKTVGLAADADYVVAGDLSIGRVRRIRSNVERVGFGGGVGLVVADGRHPPYRPVDTVLLDAPCTGTGTFRRHVDGRWRVTPADLGALVTLQRDLLSAAAGIVAPGGTLVYATCSLEPEENEDQVDWFLRSHEDFRRGAPVGHFDGTMLDGDYLRILPQRHGVDGAFSARLERLP